MKDSRLEALAQVVNDQLDPNECGTPADAFLFFLVTPDPISSLSIKTKLILLKGVYDNLASAQQKKLGGRKLSVISTLQSGDYGIDIEDTLCIRDNWKLRVKADGGSGTIYPGEERKQIEFSLSMLLGKLDSINFDLEELCWDELSAKRPSHDDIVYVTPGEGVEGCGDPSFSIISPEGKAIDIPGIAIATTRDGESCTYTVEINFSHQGQVLTFMTSFDLSDCESECKGYNLDWSADPPCESEEFAKQIDSALKDGLKMLQKAGMK